MKQFAKERSQHKHFIYETIVDQQKNGRNINTSYMKQFAKERSQHKHFMYGTIC